MQRDPNDENSMPRLEGVEDVAIVQGSGYFPVLVTLRDESLGAVVRGGDAHVGIKGRLDWIHSEDAGRTWSDPEVIVDSRWDDRNAGVGVMPDGAVVLAYAEASTYDETGTWDTSRGKYELFTIMSTDNGRTWSEKTPLCPDFLYTGSPYGRIVALRNGTALMQIYTWKEQAAKAPQGATSVPMECVGVLRSTDNGRTWGDWSLVARDHNETSLVELEDGRIVAAMRSRRGDIAVTESSDGGRTWTEPRTVTRVNHHPPDILQLDSGALLMVYGCRLSPKGVQAILSDDGGQTWGFDRRAFLAWGALNSDCGYPSAAQTADGSIVALYYAVGTAQLEGRQCRCVRFTDRQLRDAPEHP